MPSLSCQLDQVRGTSNPTRLPLQSVLRSIIHCCAGSWPIDYRLPNGLFYPIPLFLCPWTQHNPKHRVGWLRVHLPADPHRGQGGHAAKPRGKKRQRGQNVFCSALKIMFVCSHNAPSLHFPICAPEGREQKKSQVSIGCINLHKDRGFLGLAQTSLCPLSLSPSLE